MGISDNPEIPSQVWPSDPAKAVQLNKDIRNTLLAMKWTQSIGNITIPDGARLLTEDRGPIVHEIAVYDGWVPTRLLLPNRLTAWNATVEIVTDSHRNGGDSRVRTKLEKMAAESPGTITFNLDNHGDDYDIYRYEGQPVTEPPLVEFFDEEGDELREVEGEERDLVVAALLRVVSDDEQSRSRRTYLDLGWLKRWAAVA